MLRFLEDVREKYKQKRRKGTNKITTTLKVLADLNVYIVAVFRRGGNGSCAAAGLHIVRTV